MEIRKRRFRRWAAVALSSLAAVAILLLGVAGVEVHFRKADGYLPWVWPLTPVSRPAVNDPRKIYNARYVERNPALFTNLEVATFNPVNELGGDVDRPAYLFVPGYGDPESWGTDQFGFRGVPHSAPKGERTLRVFVLGGSTTEGQQGNRETWPYYLEQELARRCPGTDFQVFNAGFHGLNSHDLLSIYTHRIRRLEPDLLVYYEVGNGINEWESFAVDRSRRGLSPLSRVYWHDFLNGHSAVYRRLLTTLRLPYPPADYHRKSGEPAPSREWYLGGVKGLVEKAREDGRPILIVSPVNGYREGLWTATEIPGDVYWLYQRFNPLLPADLDWWYDQLAEGLEALAAREGVAYLDIRERFPTEREHYASYGALYDPGHYSPKGNQRLAELVADGLARTILPALLATRPGARGCTPGGG